MDKQFVLQDPTKGGAPMEAMAFIRNSEGWNSISGASGYRRAILTDIGVNTTVLRMNFR